jgi:hypothetical protein
MLRALGGVGVDLSLCLQISRKDTTGASDSSVFYLRKAFSSYDLTMLSKAGNLS